jgi:hypothetical protein
VRTEGNFVNRLKNLVKRVITPLKTGEPLILEESEIKTIFSNIE